MSRLRFVLTWGMAVSLMAAGATCGVLRVRGQVRSPGAGVPNPERRTPARTAPAPSVQDVMLRVYSLPFGEPTPLKEVENYLHQTLQVPVILDLGALRRLNLTPETTVQLDLQGVRLKTGLRLLLDQVGLICRLVPEDNLLILTDLEGSEDPSDRILSEVQALRREVRDLQSLVQALYDDLEPTESEPVLRRPTIIEDRPPAPDGQPPPPPQTHSGF